MAASTHLNFEEDRMAQKLTSEARAAALTRLTG
jgi:hypothetical protein